MTLDPTTTSLQNGPFVVLDGRCRRLKALLAVPESCVIGPCVAAASGWSGPSGWEHSACRKFYTAKGWLHHGRSGHRRLWMVNKESKADDPLTRTPTETRRTVPITTRCVIPPVCVGHPTSTSGSQSAGFSQQRPPQERSYMMMLRNHQAGGSGRPVCWSTKGTEARVQSPNMERCKSGYADFPP